MKTHTHTHRVFSGYYLYLWDLLGLVENVSYRCLSRWMSYFSDLHFEEPDCSVWLKASGFKKIFLFAITSIVPPTPDVTLGFNESLNPYLCRKKKINARADFSLSEQWRCHFARFYFSSWRLEETRGCAGCGALITKWAPPVDTGNENPCPRHPSLSFWILLALAALK